MLTISGLPAEILGFRRSYVLTYAADEVLHETPEELPTSAPADPQVTYTVTGGMLTLIEPPPLNTPTYRAALYVGGVSAAASAVTIDFELYQNGAFVADGTGVVAAGDHWTINAFLAGVLTDDVLTIKIHTSDTDVSWDYQALAIFADNYKLADTDRILARVSYSIGAWPALGLGTPTIVDTGGFTVYHTNAMAAPILVTTNFPILIMESSAYGGDVYYGHQDLASQILTGANHPMYLQDAVPFGVTMNVTDIVTTAR